VTELKVLPAIKPKRCAEPLVLLHGWGCDSRSWQPLLASLNNDFDVILASLPGFDRGVEPSPDIQVYLPALLAQLPERFFIAGWSLGGMLATAMAAVAPQRVQGLITLASNVSFVQRNDYVKAMSQEDFSAFAGGFENAPEMTLKRFAGLMAKGDDSERELLKQLRQESALSWKQASEHHSEAQAQSAWSSGLQWLEQLDNRHHFSALAVPGLHLLAERDALVPPSVEETLKALNPTQTTTLIEAASHALHWSQPSQVLTAMNKFIDETHYAVDKSKVAQSFGRAATSYDSVAGLQRQIGHRLLQSVSGSSNSPNDPWLDLGCGTGYFTPKISEHLSLAEGKMVGFDLSEGMLAFAREHRGNEFTWLCGDAENLPFNDDSLSGVFSSLAIQWCANLPKLFDELSRVLVKGGEIHLATLGPRTLTELRQAWRQVDDYTHVNRFAEEETIRSAIEQCELSLLDWQSEDIVLQYDQVRDLTYELKTLGAHNMNHGQSSGLTGRQRIKKFKQAYESFRQTDGKLPATYEVFYIRLGLS